MNPIALKRAFRAHPGTEDCVRLASFLEGLESSEPAWQNLVALLERDVIPIVVRCHPDVESDEISSACFAGAFESWIPEWLDCTRSTARVRVLLAEARYDEAFAELETHPRYHGDRAGLADTLWRSHRWRDCMSLIEGTRSARSIFIARTRARISESQRKQQRQSRLMTRHCSDALGMHAPSGGQSLASEAARAICGAELERTPGERNAWLVSALPPAHLPSQDLTDRLRRMLGAIDELGSEHVRVFKLLMEGLSQRSIAEVEGRHPAVISRRVRRLQETCRVQLLE
ncbi:MAG: helix-turn-helix domain-containing protein [bacterium]|nr:helix-turn-helix domain-containing protein [bacterium]